MEKAQTWSMDVMIAVVVFILGIFIFFSIIESKSDAGGLRELIVEGEKLANIMEVSAGSENPCSFIVGNRVDKEKLAECIGNYNRTKTLLGAKKDFCVYFEDSKGNIINISYLTGHGGIGFGDPGITYSIYDETGEVIDIIKCGSNLTEIFIETNPPIISSTNVDPASGIVGTIFTITSTVTDASGVALVEAYIQLPDETDIAVVTLYDDGTNGDVIAGDDIYTNTWDSTGQIGGTYYVDIIAEDTLGNTGEDDNAASFTVLAL